MVWNHWRTLNLWSFRFMSRHVTGSLVNTFQLVGPLVQPYYFSPPRASFSKVPSSCISSVRKWNLGSNTLTLHEMTAMKIYTVTFRNNHVSPLERTTCRALAWRCKMDNWISICRWIENGKKKKINRIMKQNSWMNTWERVHVCARVCFSVCE